MSTREVYTLTDQSSAALPPGKTAPSKGHDGTKPLGRTKPYGVSDIDPGPLPVRTPSRIMRIWVAPYQDTLGDLVTGQYVYTEIEGRKWTLGQKVVAHERGLRPLQQLQSKPGRQGKTGRTVNSPTRTGK